MAIKSTEATSSARAARVFTAWVALGVVAVVAAIAISVAVGGGGAAAAPAAGDAAAASGPTPVYVQLGEMYIKPDTRSVPAGRVRFTVVNIGMVKHEMVVIRTDTPAGKLPTNSAGEASENGAVGEVSDLGPGRDDSVTLNLKPGHYALICNLPGHYSAGMYTNFHVQ